MSLKKQKEVKEVKKHLEIVSKNALESIYVCFSNS